MASSRTCNLTEFTFTGRQKARGMFFWSTVFDSGANSNKLRGTFVSALFQGLVSTAQKKIEEKRLPLLQAGLVRHLFLQDLEFPLKTKQIYAQPLPTKISTKGKALLKDVNDLP